MSRRLVNLWLLALLIGLAASGVLGWVLPAAAAPLLYEAHRVLGVALVVSLGAKWAVARSSLRRRLPRRDPSVLVGALAGAALVASVGVGLAWTLGILSFDSLGGYSPLNLHVFAALALVPLAAWHLARRGEVRPTVGRLLRRRALLRLGALSAISLALWGVFDRVATASAPLRRLSGSKHAGSFTGNAFPLTTWLLDETPRIAPGSWRLEIGGAVREPRAFSYAELLALPRRERDAVLDCTAGWWSEQRWAGVAVADILALAGPAPRAREATVESVTGHRWTFPLEELADALIATHVGGEPLTPGHGFPARLVAPGRRGFQWVKWLRRVDVA